MKKLLKIKKSQQGFTLLEVIITLTIAAILGSFLVTFMGTSVTMSSEPISEAQNLASAEGTMESIAADYAGYLKTGTTPSWNTIKTKTYPNASITTISNFLGQNFEALEVTVTVGKQKLVSYFIQ